MKQCDRPSINPDLFAVGVIGIPIEHVRSWGQARDRFRQGLRKTKVVPSGTPERCPGEAGFGNQPPLAVASVIKIDKSCLRKMCGVLHNAILNMDFRESINLSFSEAVCRLYNIGRHKCRRAIIKGRLHTLITETILLRSFVFHPLPFPKLNHYFIELCLQKGVRDTAAVSWGGLASCSEFKTRLSVIKDTPLHVCLILIYFLFWLFKVCLG